MKVEKYRRKIKSTSAYKNAVKVRSRRDLIDNYIEMLLSGADTYPDAMQLKMFDIAYNRINESVFTISDIIIKYLDDSKIKFNINWEEECLSELREVSSNAFDKIDKEIVVASEVVLNPILERFNDDTISDSLETYYFYNKIASMYLDLLKTEESFHSQLKDCINIMISGADYYFGYIKECMEVVEESLSKEAIISEENMDVVSTILSNNTDKVYKHRTYKELNKIAEDLGYKAIRFTGDHGIYSKQNSSIVIIPQGRNIGKGLQLKILKDLNV